MPKNFRNIFFLFVTSCCVLFSLPSCRVAKNLPQGQSLLVKNKFIIKNKIKYAEKERIHEDFAKIAAQKPNRRFLQIMPFKMWLYYNATRGKKLTKFKQWIIDKVGEAPVVYDSTLTEKSVSSMENYLFNYGYFHAHVTDTVITKKKRTRIIFNIQTNELWKIGDVELPKEHNICDSLVCILKIIRVLFFFVITVSVTCAWK